MSLLKKLLKSHDGLQDELDLFVGKAVAAAKKEAEKTVKAAVKDVVVAVKDHPEIDRVATKVAIEIIKASF